MKKLLVSLMMVFAIANVSMAQEVALKWNAAALAVGGVNVGAEFSVAPKWTLSLEGTPVFFNPWKSQDISANGWTATFAARWYTCQAFNGHHLGLYATVGRFGDMTVNQDLFSSIFTGGSTAVGARNVQTAMVGLEYGYYWKLAHGWGLDFYIGGGAVYARAQNLNPTAANNDTFVDTGIKFNVSRFGIALSYKF